MKRHLVLATLALGSIGFAGCGSGGPEGAGERAGAALGELQTVVMARSANFDTEGLERYVERVKGDVPAESYAQMQEAVESIKEKVTEAENHPEELAQASIDGFRQLDAVQGAGSALADFKKGLREGFDEATN